MAAAAPVRTMWRVAAALGTRRAAPGAPPAARFATRSAATKASPPTGTGAAATTVMPTADTAIGSVPHPVPGLAPTLLHGNPASVLRTPLVRPKYWTGTQALPVETFTIDAAEYDLPSHADALVKEGGIAALPGDLRQRIVDMYDEVGLVVLRNTGLGDNMKAMQHTTEPVFTDVMAYEGGSNSRGEIEENVFDTGAPKEAWLHYHHEMAYVGRSTKRVAFCCSAAPGDGTGPTFVSEGVGTTEMLLNSPMGQKLKELGITYIRCMTDRESGLDDGLENDVSPVYNHWQRSLGVETREEAEAAAHAKGLETEWGPNGYLKTKYTVSAFEYFAPLERNLLYAAVADDSMWFDTWPGVRHLPTMDDFSVATQNERPLKITYGDGSDFTREELQFFVDIYDAYGIRLDWNKGDIAMVCNFRFAHGRPEYTLLPGQERTLGVVLGETYTRQGQRDDKW